MPHGYCTLTDVARLAPAAPRIGHPRRDRAKAKAGRKARRQAR